MLRLDTFYELYMTVQQLWNKFHPLLYLIKPSLQLACSASNRRDIVILLFTKYFKVIWEFFH